MSFMLTTIRRAFVVLLVAMLGIAFAQTAAADQVDDSQESTVQSESEERGKAKNADDEADTDDESPSKGKASDHRTSAQVGDYDEAQPSSTADDTDNGANLDGGYDSTRDGDASDNGNGDGEATGLPCEACVGQADNKNPAGQDPHGLVGDDPNNGYECDGNNGIAKGNPAHSDCDSTTGTEVPTAPETEVEGTTVVPSGSAEVKGLQIVREIPVAELVPAEVAPAAVEVLGIQEVRSAPAAEVLPAAEAAPAAVVTQPAGQSLPLTGANILVLLMVAAVVGTLGTIVTRMAGRKAELI